MTSTTFFFVFIPILAIILLSVNLIFAPHNPYQEKDSAFECGFHSFLGQNRTQFSISFFIFALLFLLFDLEILLVYPYVVSAYTNGIYGLVVMLIFFLALTLGFAFELGKNALKIDSRQVLTLIKKNYVNMIAFTISSPKGQGYVISPLKSDLDYITLIKDIVVPTCYHLKDLIEPSLSSLSSLAITGLTSLAFVAVPAITVGVLLINDPLPALALDFETSRIELDNLRDFLVDYIEDLSEHMIGDFLYNDYNNLDGFFNSGEFHTIYDNLSEVLNRMEGLRDNMITIYRTIERLYPDSLEQFNIGGIVLEHGLDINGLLVPVWVSQQLSHGDTVDLMRYWEYNDLLFQLLENYMGTFLTFV